ncbi:globin domain-containing protein [Sulfitobacter sp. JB4-11]|uniref:globin domain-containing protein n=1 Tax=Sulfitobacter rhodophyticola TaxID=3238304 RepID=UPI0035113AFD
MSIKTSEKELLQESFRRLEADFDTFSTDFYEALFRRAPELRALFREDLAGQGMKFVATLREVILNAEDAEKQAETLAELGSFHATIGVSTDSYDVMEEALIDTIRQTLGNKVTPDLETAWRNAYAETAATMIRSGHKS